MSASNSNNSNSNSNNMAPAPETPGRAQDPSTDLNPSSAGSEASAVIQVEGDNIPTQEFPHHYRSSYERYRTVRRYQEAHGIPTPDDWIPAPDPLSNRSIRALARRSLIVVQDGGFGVIVGHKYDDDDGFWQVIATRLKPLDDDAGEDITAFLAVDMAGEAAGVLCDREELDLDDFHPLDTFWEAMFAAEPAIGVPDDVRDDRVRHDVFTRLLDSIPTGLRRGLLIGDEKEDHSDPGKKVMDDAA